jgi:hypothetical protein
MAQSHEATRIPLLLPAGADVTVRALAILAFRTFSFFDFLSFFPERVSGSSLLQIKRCELQCGMTAHGTNLPSALSLSPPPPSAMESPVLSSSWRTALK